MIFEATLSPPFFLQTRKKHVYMNESKEMT